jgi:hypothetical protein
MSREYDAVKHVLTSPPIAGRTAPYIHEDDFDFAGLGREAESMSTGEALLVRVGEELWHGEKRAGLLDLVRRLDLGNFDRVVQALKIARGPRSLDYVS